MSTEDGHPGEPVNRSSRPPKWAQVFDRSWLRRLYQVQCTKDEFLERTRHRVVMRTFADDSRLRIGFLTDFHFGEVVPDAFLRRGAGAIMRMEPDLILLGGDYWNEGMEGEEAARDILGLLEAPLGIYGVLGNHDHDVSAAGAVELLDGLGIGTLINEGVLLEDGPEPLWLCGVDDEWYGEPDFGAALEGRPEGVSALALAHNPVSLLRCSQRWPTLCLSGHTHGGQVCWPDGRAVWVDNAQSLNHSSGWTRVGSTWLYVSRGIGSATIPLRLYCRPEVTIIDLVGRGALDDGERQEAEAAAWETPRPGAAVVGTESEAPPRSAADS